MMKTLWKNINYAVVVVIAGNILAFINDTPASWSSPEIPKLLSVDADINPLGRPITSEEESWIGSYTSLGSCLGALPFGILADKIGRKPVILFLAVPHFIAYVLFIFAQNVYFYYVGRFLNGISYMGCYTVLPMYIAEISEQKYRGMMIGSYAIFASFGDLFCYIVGPYTSMKTFNIILSVFPVVFFITYLILAPESPYFLIDKSESKTVSSLKTLRSNNNIENEWLSIQIEKGNNERGAVLETLKKKYVIKGIIIAFGLICFQQLTGIMVILTYTQKIFDESGVSMSSEIPPILMGSVLFIVTISGLFIVDKKGRKMLLLCSAIGMFLSLSALGIYFLIKDRTTLSVQSINWLPILCLVLYGLSFSSGFGPLAITVSTEVMPSNIKFYAITCINSLISAMNFLLTRYFNDMTEALGNGGTFLIFAGFCFLALLFVIFILPETKGRHFHEIQDILDRKSFFLHKDYLNKTKTNSNSENGILH